MYSKTDKLPSALDGPFHAEALKVGLLLPPDWEPIAGADWLSSLAQQRGLPASSSWRDLAVFDANELRMQAAEQLGLPSSSTWHQINSASGNG